MGQNTTLLAPRERWAAGGSVKEKVVRASALPGPGLTLPPPLQAVLKNLAEAVGGRYHCYSLDAEVSLLPFPPPPRRPPPRFALASGPGPSRLSPCFLALPQARWASTGVVR